jgi:UDP-N-acetylmuramate dehydrogenase
LKSRKNVQLKKYNSLGVEALAAKMLFIQSEKDLLGIEELINPDRLFILGEGTNTLFSKDFEGSIVKVEIRGLEYKNVDENRCLATIGAGENWHQFVTDSLDKGLQGLENLSLIPGSVGAAPIQNIGAYGVEVSELIDFVEGYNLVDGRFEKFNRADCGFRYRSSMFKEQRRDQFIISRVGFSLNRNWSDLEASYKSLSTYLDQNGIKNPSPLQLSKAVVQIRKSKLPDPNKIGNAGSFFKNPVVNLKKFEELKKRFPGIPGFETEPGKVKLFAAWLIEQSGWKGKDLGKVGVHQDQALVLVNKGGAKGIEIYELSQKLKADIRKNFDILLEEEVRIL